MADQRGDFITGLVAGAVVGGIVGGVIGVVLAPRFLKSATPPDPEDAGTRKRNGDRALPNRSTGSTPLDLEALSSDSDQVIAQARRTLEDKIAQLNEAIRETRAQLLVKDPSR